MRIQGPKAESRALAVEEHAHEGSTRTPRDVSSWERKTEIRAVFVGYSG